jgi:hypothetical protein
MIFADEGMVLTDGNSYGSTISLAEGRKPDEYTEITIEEFEKRMAETETESMS